MPSAPPRRCAHCHQLVAGRCPHCDTAWVRKPASWRRNSTSDPRWRSTRTERLRIDPWCQLCGDVATQADHLDGTDYTDDSGQGTSWLNIDMTRSLCQSCHQQRTARQGNDAKRRKDVRGYLG